MYFWIFSLRSLERNRLFEWYHHSRHQHYSFHKNVISEPNFINRSTCTSLSPLLEKGAKGKRKYFISTRLLLIPRTRKEHNHYYEIDLY